MALDSLEAAPTVPQQPSFAELRWAIQSGGLLERQPFYYAWRISLTLVMLIPGVVVLLLFDSPLIQLLNAVYCAVAFKQIIFIGHDCGHRQVFTKGMWNDILALCCMPTVGIGYSWWCNTHNQHHAHPNRVGADPAVEYDAFAFSRAQALRKTGLNYFLVRFQALYLVPAALFYPVLMRIRSIGYILREKPKFAVAEAIMFTIHFPIYFWLVFGHLNLWTGLMFVVVQQGLFSLFLVSTFAPNHKGMPLLEDGDQMDFLHQQVLTAQNVQSGRFADFWFGGLNYQIEHHLFPRISRNKLREARKIVKPFCERHGLLYREARAPRCYWDILKFLHRVGRPLRGGENGPADTELTFTVHKVGGSHL
jgi:fatty acid desaturase